ncbi:multidrug/Oligosaccharidyl-lipid/Polysaccharide flippase [Hysterangium stoloniferum]|nr:multidrug/Oligosaccharidyl-lipid/Polysaccharide flippase [Hysterangium stoloniferum]
MSIMHQADSEQASKSGYGTTTPTVISVEGAKVSPYLSERQPLLGRPPGTEDEDGRIRKLGKAEIKSTWWNEFWLLSKYTAPVFGTNILEYSFFLVSVVSIGHISTTALAGASLGSMTAAVTGYSIVQGFVNSLDTLLPGAWTSSRPELVGLWSQRAAVVLSIVLIEFPPQPISCIWINAESLLLLLKQEPETARIAALYLRLSLLGLPAYTFNNIARRYFQAQGLFTIPTRIVIILAPVNALLNYLLVWGPKSIRFGFVGAPLATALSLNMMSLLNVLYGVYYTPKTAWTPFSRRSFTGLSVVSKLGIAGVGQTASEWWSWELVSLAASFLGPTSLASQSILLATEATSFQAPFSLSVVTSVRVGNLLGEGNAHGARIASSVSLVMASCMGAVLSAIFLVFRQKWAYLFNDDPKVVALVASVLPIVAFFQIIDAIAGASGGILRARGMQSTGALINVSAYYVIGIPFGLFLTFHLKAGLVGLWIGLTVALIFVATAGVWICLCADWEMEVLKVSDRVERERKLGNLLAGVDVEAERTGS